MTVKARAGDVEYKFKDMKWAAIWDDLVTGTCKMKTGKAVAETMYRLNKKSKAVRHGT